MTYDHSWEYAVAEGGQVGDRRRANRGPPEVRRKVYPKPHPGPIPSPSHLYLKLHPSASQAPSQCRFHDRTPENHTASLSLIAVDGLYPPINSRPEDFPRLSRSIGFGWGLRCGSGYTWDGHRDGHQGGPHPREDLPTLCAVEDRPFQVFEVALDEDLKLLQKPSSYSGILGGS